MTYTADGALFGKLTLEGPPEASLERLWLEMAWRGPVDTVSDGFSSAFDPASVAAARRVRRRRAGRGEGGTEIYGPLYIPPHDYRIVYAER